MSKNIEKTLKSPPYPERLAIEMLGVELDYLPCVQMSCFSRVWTPYPNRGVSGAAPPKGIFYEKCLVKYCNFIVNLDHSLCCRSDGRSYVYLRVFCLRRQPSIIYEGIVLRLCIILRDETVRERRGSYNRFVVGCIPSVCWMK